MRELILYTVDRLPVGIVTLLTLLQFLSYAFCTVLILEFTNC